MDTVVPVTGEGDGLNSSSSVDGTHDHCVPVVEVISRQTEDTVPLVTEEADSSSENESKGISEYGAAFLITNAALGGGLLNFPLAFHEAGGIVPGNVMHFFFLLATLGSLYIMSYTASRYHSKTYQQMVTSQCGTFMGHFTAACIALYCLITCVTFIIIVGDQTDRFFADMFGPHFCDFWPLRRTFTMIIAGFVVLCLSYFRDMEKLLSMGLLGSVFMVYLAVVIFFVYMYGGYTPGEVLIFDKKQFSHMFDVLPTICFGYQCHVSSVPIYHSIRNRSKAKYFKACSIAMFACALVYAVSANFGYLTFGSNVADDLLLSYDFTHPGGIAIEIAIFVLALKSITTYPVLMYCVREAIVSFYVSARRLTEADAARTERTRRIVLVTVLWLISVACALLAENIDVVVRLLGSLAVFFIFILPGFCLFVNSLELEDGHLVPKSRYILARVLGIFYILLGIFTFGLSLSLAIDAAIHTDNESHQLCIPYVHDNLQNVTQISRHFTISRFHAF